MDVNKLLKTVHNLNDYISVTQEVVNKHSSSKIQFNMSTVLSLKKIRSLEIEYFNKCDESGAGIKILQLMLRLPPSKTWSLLGKELILLMQYWLEAIRKHLILHNNHWWNFLSTLLELIQAIRSKHIVLSNILVQDLSECLLDLATKSQPTVVQRFKVLQCYNSVCAESSRETRYALKNKLGIYFVKLSSILPSCGDVRAQYSIMETLLRWLVPRQNVTIKHEAAAKWFPPNLYNGTARKIFIERPWQNFFKDAREFLNALNTSSDLITTVLCRRFSIGNVTLISDADKDYYLDLNTSTEVISLMVEPCLSDVLGTSVSNAVIISKDNTNTIKLHRESSQVLISINIIDPGQLYPSPVLQEHDIQIAVSSRSDLVKLNRALRRIFDTEYELLMDFDNPPPLSPPRGERPGSDNRPEETRFSNSVEISKRIRSGCCVRPRLCSSRQSPSSASTSSLALLRERLSALPGYRFDRQPVSVVAAPQLSSLTEYTERTEHSEHSDRAELTERTEHIEHSDRAELTERTEHIEHSDRAELTERTERTERDDTPATHTLRSYGVCTHKYQRGDDTARSDEEANKCKTIPNDFEETSVSCLLVATIGSDESVIKDTLERLPGDRELHTDNIVELLAREAFRSSGPRLYGGVVTDENNDDVIKNTGRPTAVINKTRDMSNTVIGEDVQVSNDRRDITLASKENEPTTYDEQAVEDFFSQHCSRNRDGDLLISPTLAKKINETSSESSLDFDIRTPVTVDNQTNQYDVHFNFDDAEIIECLNDMVDKVVCENLESCTEHVSKEIEDLNLCDKEFRTKTPLKEVQNMEKNTNKKQNKNTRLKLQYKNTKPLKTRGRKQNKLTTENVKRMTTIIEKDSDVEKTLLKNSSPESNTRPLNSYETPLIKRKRKLYSPKDDRALNEKTGIHISETEDDYSILTGTGAVDTTPKAAATSYKDIEKLRTTARNLRIRKSGINLSPRTKKNNDIFDSLKKTVEGEVKIILADKKTKRNKKLAVYNFSSDSEDDDFQVRKGMKKCTSTVGSVKSAKSTRARKSNNEKKNKSVRRRKSKTNIKQVTVPRNEMIDERIREAAAEALNTSIVIEQQNDLIPQALEPIILEKPQMEIIEDVKDLPIRRTTRRKRPANSSVKKEKVTHKDKNVPSDREPSVRSSPLPGLIIETVQVQIHKDPEDSITTAMLDKYKDIYNNEPLPDISAINTTHNLLSDLEQITYDSNVTEEFNATNRSVSVSKRLRDDVLHNSPKAKQCKLATLKVREAIQPQVITLSDASDAKSDKSIATLGKSPITGHGDLDESPPNTDQLQQRYEPRGLETQDFNQSMKNYFNSLTKDICEASQSSHSEIVLDKTVNAKELEGLEKSPVKLMKDMSSANISPTVSITRLSPREIARWLPARFNSVFGSNQSSEDDRPVRITRSHTRSQGQLRKKDPIPSNTKSSKIDLRKSVISPIKMFEEVNKKNSLTSDNNDRLQEIQNTATAKSKVLKTANTKPNSTRYYLRKCSSKAASSKSSSNVDGLNKTGRSPSEVEAPGREKTGTIISDFGSGQGSSINEWFHRNELQSRSRAERADFSLKDNLENTIEKLETTLTEIHHRTSTKFVSMFVNAQNHLADLKEKRRQLYKQTALELMTDIVKVMDDKFGELERRSQDLDSQFMEGLRNSARDVMSADCEQKRAMLSLLKEDVQTALNHFNKGGTNM